MASEPGVIGKPADIVAPTTIASPRASTVTAYGVSVLVPPRNVDHSSAAPEAESAETKPSVLPPLYVTSNAPGVTWKPGDAVSPTTTILPLRPAAIARP